jgi:lysophospholipase L1-like esterase
MSKPKKTKALHRAKKSTFRSLAPAVAISLLLPIALFFAAEGCISFALSHPRVIPKGYPLNLLRYYYANFERDIIQFSDACARYDYGLFYTLKPGTCRFANREFDLEYSINSLGVRDDEAALNNPEIVVIGDSQAMGWAVGREQTFSALIGKMTGKKILNTGVSSYGTAREMIMLDRVARGRLKYLIIQYSDNDYDENRYFASNNYSMSISSAEKYEQVRRFHKDNTEYYPGKHLLTLIKIIRSPDISISDPVASPYQPYEIDAFLQVLQNSRPDLRNLKIIVFEANPYAVNNRPFLENLKKQIKNPSYPDHIRNISVLDLGKELNAGRYLTLDDHMNADGHRLIAERVTAVIQALENKR